MALIPDDFLPHDRTQAQMVANERGCAWYLYAQAYERIVYLVKKDTPAEEYGEKCVKLVSGYQYAGAHNIVLALNQAYLLGQRSKES